MARFVEKTLTSFKEQLPIHNHLKAVMEPDGSSDQGQIYWKYKGDWTDEKVAQKFGYTASQITRFRVSQDFIFHPGRNAKDNISPWRQRIEETMARMDQMDKRMVSQEQELQRLRSENAVLRTDINAARDEQKRLHTLINNHAASLNELESRANGKWAKGLDSLGKVR